ncbi:MAG: hypothetical protein ACLQHK_06815 [Gallionellaceae bacterium]
MNFSSGITPAAPALAFTEIHGERTWQPVWKIGRVMAEIRNYTMNFSSGITLAAPALAFTEIHGERTLQPV